MSERIRAAGGVVWQRSPGRVEVALIHRERYDDWTLPKGKLQCGESELQAAVREVGEETGLRVAVTRRLPGAAYEHRGTPKTVAFWAMRSLGGTFVRSSEVDDFAWLPVPDAGARLTYAGDRAVLEAFASAPVPDTVVVLLRHAKAGSRARWNGHDDERPLDADGVRQARWFADVLPLFAPDHVVSAGLARCVQTVEPFAAQAGLSVEIVDELSDRCYQADPDASLAALRALARPGSVVVASSQGETVPGLIGTLAASRDPATRKGGFWVLCFTGGELVSADPYPPP